MAKIGVLRGLLLFVRHVDQDVETATLLITIDNRQPLLLVEFQQLPHCGAKVLEVSGVFFTASQYRRRVRTLSRIIDKHCLALASTGFESNWLPTAYTLKNIL
jgi:hypothetical protein